ncbi:MAG TPA: TolC family protein, partial [Terriglobia bacterium]|nr:TolC family protein [Terriglobia bacterium]
MTLQRIFVRRRKWLLAGAACVVLLSLLSPRWAAAQEPETSRPDYSRSLGWVALLKLEQFRPLPVPEPSFQNSALLPRLLDGGKLALSVAQLDQAVVENNLAIAAARYTVAMADADLLKARSGQNPSGTVAAPIPGALGSASFGSGGGGGPRNFAGPVNVGPRGSFDPALTLSLTIDTNTVPLNNTRVTGVSSVVTHTTAVQARYTQAFTTGTSFSVNFNVQRSSSTSRNQRFNPSFTSNYNLSVNQQLFSGFGFAMNRRYQTVAETNRQTAKHYFAQQAIAQLVQSENRYWDLVAAKETVRAAAQALAVAEQLLRDNRLQVEIGTLAPLDVTVSEAEVAARRRDLIVAQTAEQRAALDLKHLLARQMEEALAATAVETTDPLPEPRDSDIPAFEEAVGLALRHRPELLQAEGNLKNQEVAVAYTRQRLRPTVSVFGVLSSVGREADLTASWAQLRRLDFPEYAYGLSVSFPIGNRAAQADHQEALLNRQQGEAALQRTREQIRREVRNALIGLTQAKAQVRAAQVAVERSVQTLDAEQKKLR